MVDSKKNFLDKVLKAAAEDPGLKEMLLKNPKEVFESRLNFKLPENFEIVVHEDTPVKINIVLPSESEELSEFELAAVAGGICWSDTGDSDCPIEWGHSDVKLKDNVVNPGSALDKIKKLQPKVFNYRDDGIYSKMKLPGGTHFGFIAQELEKVFPELVKESVFSQEGSEEIKYKSITMIELIPVLIQGMKEQQQIIEDLKKEIEELKTSQS
jgi:hypothetical protein